MMTVYGTDSKDADEVVMKHQYIRNNLKNQDRALFFTQFNSNVCSIDPLVKGEGTLKVKVAMPYPEEYNAYQNYFEASVKLNVVDKIQVNIAEYSLKDKKSIHKFLLPPNTVTKIHVIGDY